MAKIKTERKITVLLSPPLCITAYLGAEVIEKDQEMREGESVYLTLFGDECSASAAAADVVALPHLPVRLKPAASEKGNG